MNPTEVQLDAIRSFHRWARSLFDRREPWFECRPFLQPDGGVEINGGSMRLEFFRSPRLLDSIRLLDISQGMRIVVFSGASLEKALLAALTYSIKRKFINTFIP